MLEWSCLNLDPTGVSTRSIYVELEATLEENRVFQGLPKGVASQVIRKLNRNLRRSQDVCSSQALVKMPRRLLHPDSGYLVPATIAHEVLYPFLPHIESRMADFRRALWVATGGIRWWLTLKYSSSFKDSIADHRSFSIPKNIAYIDTITHFLEVLVRILTMLCWQKRFGSLAIRPELTYGRSARENDTESYLKHVEEIRWNFIPYELLAFAACSRPS